MNVNRVMALIFSILFLSACSVMNTVPVSSSNSHIENKIPYFLPTGKLNVKMFSPDPVSNPEKCEVTIKEVYIAERLLFLKYNPSIWSSDSEIKIEVDTQGFLTTIAATTRDESPKIIAGLVEIAKVAMGIPPAPVTAQRVAKPCELDLTFDPFNQSEMDEVLAKMQEFEPEIDKIVIVPMFSKDGAEWQQNAIDIQQITTGIAYLTRLPYKVKIKMKNVALELTQMVYLPNESPIFTLDVKRRPFIENKTAITFKNGVLQTVRWDKPSEALGFINIPIDIARAIMAIPGELLNVKVSNLDGEKGLLEAQKEHIQAQLDLIAKKSELEKQTDK